MGRQDATVDHRLERHELLAAGGADQAGVDRDADALGFVDQLPAGHVVQLVDVLGGEPEPAQQLLGIGGGASARAGADQRAAHDARPVEQPFAAGIPSSSEVFDAPPESPNTITRLGIAAEAGDVVADPAQGQHDVEHAGVAGVGVASPAISPRCRKPNGPSRWLMVTTTTSPRPARLAPSYIGHEPEPVLNAPPCSQTITARAR